MMMYVWENGWIDAWSISTWIKILYNMLDESCLYVSAAVDCGRRGMNHRGVPLSGNNGRVISHLLLHNWPVWKVCRSYVTDFFKCMSCIY